ncbi:MAG: autophagy-related protein 11-domain-containing protein [Benjaminiella poitrasii]|nr:MAG: autophagy-related protein 11-domain-containing protein [Benjaminiella poitrasii]
MKAFRAETGRPIRWHAKSNTIKTVDDLKRAFEDDCGVPVSDQILMTSFGKLVRQDNLTQVLAATGKDEFIIFCYDRRYLTVDEESVDALLDSETPSLEPRIPPFDGSSTLTQFQQSILNKSLQETCQAFMTLFSNFDSHSQLLTKTAATHTHLAQHMVQAQKCQSMALNVAITNLDQHRHLANNCIRQFLTDAKHELDHQHHLLRTIDQDLTLLRHIPVHHHHSASKKRLIDYVDLADLERARVAARAMCDDLTDQRSSLQDEMRRLDEDEASFSDGVAEKNKQLQDLDALLVEVVTMHDKCSYLRDKVRRDVRRVYEKMKKVVPLLTEMMEGLKLSDKRRSLTDSVTSSSSSSSLHTTTMMNSIFSTLSHSSSTPTSHALKLNRLDSNTKRTFDAFRHLADIHVNDYLPKLAEYERRIRDSTAYLVTLKREAISGFVRHMAVVSEFQRHVGNIPPIVDRYQLRLDQFRSQYNNNSGGLGSLRESLFAYGAWMIETVRRQEYEHMLVRHANTLADALGEFAKEEEARRERFNRLVKQGPFKLAIPAPVAQCEVTVHGLSNNKEDVVEGGLERQDVLDFISIVGQVYYAKSPSSKLAATTNEQDGQVLDTMMKEMEEMNVKFRNVVKESIVHDDDDGASSDREMKKTIVVNSPMLPRLVSIAASVSSSSTSDFSVVEDDQKKLLAENKELKSKLESMEALLEQKNQEHSNELGQLHELVKTLEIEKEEFESHRRSFLYELMNKDKSADFRIASAEEDFHAKMSDLRYELEEEKLMKKNLEIEHASELNTLQTEHAAECKRLQDRLEDEQQRTSRAQLDLDQLQRRLDQLTSKNEYRIGQLEAELEAKERATNEIRQLQEQTRAMVKRAQEDWEAKSEELDRIKTDRSKLVAAVEDLLHRWSTDDDDKNEQQQALEVRIGHFKHNLEVFEREYEINKANLEAATQELTELTEGYGALTDAHDEWRTIASRMAERLEDFRKHLVFEIVNQLQLPVDEGVLNVLQQKVTGSEDDAAIWNQVLQLASAIDTSKFVVAVRKRVRDVYDQAKQFKKEYRNSKEKYNKLYASYSEKITFRNFRVGDVALFTPSRNSPDGKPWAAFNINSPHYFLNSPETSKEYVLARITAIREHVVTGVDNNPYNLAEGATYYVVDAEHWRKQQHTSKKRPISHDSGLASITTEQPQQQAKRPSFGGSVSSTGFVHSYTTTSTQQQPR